MLSKVSKALQDRGIKPGEAELLFPGRSLALQYALYDTLSRNGTEFSIRSFPISNFKSTSLSPKEERVVFDHFDKYLGADNFGERPVVILDYSQSGDSIIAVDHYINRWLAVRGKNVRVVSLAIGSMDTIPTAGDFSVIPIESRVFKEYMAGSLFDEVAPTIYWDIFNPPSNPDLDGQKARYETFRADTQSRVICRD